MRNLLNYCTINTAVPVMFVAGSVAVIVVVPAETAIASPCEPDVLLIVETSEFKELHVTDVVISA